MRPLRHFVAVALAGLFAVACGESVRVYRGQPKAPPTTEAASSADPDAFRKQKPSPGKPGSLEFPVPEVTRLSNGLTLYLVERPAPVVTLSLVTRAGASSVPAGKSGLAALTARLLTESTTTRSALELAEAVESLGTTLDADAGRDEARVGLTALESDLDQALALLAEVVQKPAFSPKDFERVRAEWLDGLASERQQPQRLASLAALRLLNGPVHGAPVRGSIPDVKKLKLEELRDFHRRAFVPKSSALIVVGRFEKEGLKKSIERHFGAWRGGAPLTPLPFTPPAAPEKTKVVLVDRPDSVQSALFAIQPFPKRSEPGYEVREVLGKVVGGLFTSRINLNLREEHAFTYGAFAQPIATAQWGAFLASTSVRTDVTADALKELVKELEKAKNPALGAPIQPAEVARGKADLVHSLGASLEHGSRLAEVVTTLFVDSLPADYGARYPRLLEPIDAPAVTQAAQALTPDRLTVVVVGDRKAIEPSLVQQGFAVELAKPELTE
jgi:zinc protease